MSVSMKVQAKLQRMKRGEPFSITGFYSLGSRTSVQKAISRLTQEGDLVRMQKGFYVRPKPIESFPSLKTTASAEQVARAWAREYGYKLVNQGHEEAYRLGFQTQSPMKKVFWSDGPSREFKVGNQVVEVLHTSKQKLRWERKPEGRLLRGMLVTPPEALSSVALKKAAERLALPPNEIVSIADKLSAVPLLSKWKDIIQMLKEVAR